MLQQLGKSLSDFDIPLPDIPVPNPGEANYFITKELSCHKLLNTEISTLVHQLNSDQRRAYDAVLHAYNTKTSKTYFIDGPVGTGKTFLYSTILHSVRSKGDIALAVAGSGIAALLLEGGQTAHSRFKVPIPTLEDSTCTFPDDVAELLTKAKLIIWDEAPMTHRRVFDCVDRSLKDLMKKIDPLNERRIFGGKIVVFGGDFRQIPPVVKRGCREDTVASCLNAPQFGNKSSQSNSQSICACYATTVSQRANRIEYGLHSHSIRLRLLRIE